MTFQLFHLVKRMSHLVPSILRLHFHYRSPSLTIRLQHDEQELKRHREDLIDSFDEYRREVVPLFAILCLKSEKRTIEIVNSIK